MKLPTTKIFPNLQGDWTTSNTVMKIWYKRRFKKKSRKKGKEYVEVFEQNEVAWISNFIKINKEKIHADSLNLRIANKTMKENWKIKAKVTMQKRYYCKVKIILNKGEYLNLKVGKVCSITYKAIFKLK